MKMAHNEKLTRHSHSVGSGSIGKILFLFVLAVVCRTDAIELKLHSHSASSAGVELTTILANSPKGNAKFNVLVGTESTINPMVAQLPVNLWLLVDNSILCRTKEIDRKVGDLLANLGKQLHEQSLVTLVTYSHAERATLHYHQPVQEVTGADFQCNTSVVSASYDSALKTLLNQSPTQPNLPLVVWIYTSGNIRISKATADKAKKRQASVHLVLYNDPVKDAIQPLVNRTRKWMGPKRFRFSSVTSDEFWLPEQWYQIKFTPPDHAWGLPFAFKVRAQVGEKTAWLPLRLNLPPGAPASIWKKILFYGSGILLLLFLGYLIYKVVRFYLPKYCPSCKKRQRYYDKSCLFCEDSRQAYLVGTHDISNLRHWGKQVITPLKRPISEIGTHRGSLIKLLRARKERRLCHASIRRENLNSGKFAYRLVVSGSPEARVLLNGRSIRTDRYLATGDKLSIRGNEMIFYQKQAS